GLPINSKGLDIDNYVVQAFIFQLEESSIELKNTRKKLHESLETIDKLHKQLEEISNSSNNESTNNSINSESLSCIFEELISKEKLGLLILPEVCWIVENPDLEISEPNLTTYNNIQYKNLEKTSANEAINYLKLNYSDKKTNYPKSFAACHVLAVLYNNVGLLEMLNIVRSAGDLYEFSD
ncbi:14701_t:CDS:2, partial [Cetraspora pellucida]